MDLYYGFCDPNYRTITICCLGPHVRRGNNILCRAACGQALNVLNTIFRRMIDMKKITQFFLAAGFSIMLGCSSSSPQDQLREIDTLMKKGFPLTSEQQESVTSLVTEGKILLDQGKEKESSEALAKALDVLHIAEDAYIFNKAD